MRVLILGGTTEASALARRIAPRHDLAPILSLAGRTKNPTPPPIPLRIGGFGGIAGLKIYLTTQQIDAVIDATHPFAAQMSRHASTACRDLGLPIAALTRPPWRPQVGDRWTGVPDMTSAARALGADPRKVFLTVGALQLTEFADAPHHHYLIRTIDPPATLSRLASHRLILARGPFSLDDELALMRAERIDALVTKNSGGTATAAKLAAARALNMEVIIVERPAPENDPAFETPDEILNWLDTHRPAP
jgi:precorrin-6A/cobalt-precorrin-6A reductase